MYAVNGDQWVGYDDEDTLQTKVDYLAERRFAGGMVWALDLDDFGNGYPLISAIKTGLDAIVTTPTTNAPTPAPTSGSPLPAPTPSPSQDPTSNPTPAPTDVPVSTAPTEAGLSFAPTGSPATSEPTTAAPTQPPATDSPTTIIPTNADGPAPCDDGSPRACKSQCSATCRGRGSDVQTNQCWGTPRYIQCDCRDGSAHSFDGCPCENSLCPSMPTGEDTTIDGGWTWSSTDAAALTTSASGGGGIATNKLIGYYTNWAQYRPTGQQYFPEDIDASLLTHICYAFAVLNSNYNVVPFEWNDIVDWNPSQGMYARFHTHVRTQNPAIKTLISLGGWTFNEREATKHLFTNMVETQVGRDRFIQSAISFARTHSFDGVDIDWEYPAHAGQGGRPQDKTNFVFLLSEFRAAIAAEAAEGGAEPLLLTIAVGAAGPTVENGYQIDQIHQHLDWIGVMSYDLHGSWEGQTGLHTSMDGTDPMSVLGGMQQWMDGGAPADKLVMGFATYGRGWTLAAATDSGIGAAAAGGSSAGAVTRAAGFLAWYEIESLIQRGGSAHYDATTQCMYAVNGDQWVGYDDENTLRQKVNYMAQHGFAGGMVWALDLDDFNNGYPLTSAIKNAMGDMPAPGTPTTIMDGGTTLPSTVGDASTTIEAETTPQSTASTAAEVFVWAPLIKMVPAFDTTTSSRIAHRFAGQLEDTNMRVAGIGAVPIELDQQQGWLFAAAFRPNMSWPTDPPGLSTTTAMAVSTIPQGSGVCTGCRDGLLGDCKRLSDSTCWTYSTDDSCPSDAVECANEDNTVVVTFSVPMSSLNASFQETFRRTMVTLLCTTGIRPDGTSYSDLPDCENTVRVVIVPVSSSNGVGRRRQVANAVIGLYAVEDQSVILASSILSVVEPALEIAGAVVAEVTTLAAEAGPDTDFDCDALPSGNCTSMQTACDAWCRGPSRPNTCDLQTQIPGTYPTGTVVHQCACVSNPAQTVCTFMSTVRSISWSVGLPVLIVNRGDVLYFRNVTGGTVLVWELVSEAAFASCDFAGAEALPTDEAAGLSHMITTAGKHFFAHPIDCQNGLKMQVVARDGEVQVTDTTTRAVDASSTPVTASTMSSDVSTEFSNSSTLLATSTIASGDVATDAPPPAPPTSAPPVASNNGSSGSSSGESDDDSGVVIVGVVTALALVVVVGVILTVLVRRRHIANKGRPTRPAIENPIYGGSAENEFGEAAAAVSRGPSYTAATPSSLEDTRFIVDSANNRISLVCVDADDSQQPEDVTYSSPQDVDPGSRRISADTTRMSIVQQTAI